MLAAFLASPLARILPIGMILLALQKTLFVELTPFGVIIQVVMAYGASMGAAGGAEAAPVQGKDATALAAPAATDAERGRSRDNPA